MDMLIITQDFPPEQGGIQTYVLELARGFVAEGHTVRVICPGSKTDANPVPGLADLVRLPVPSSLLFVPLLTYLPRYLRRNPSVTRILYAQWQSVIAETFLFQRKRHQSYCLVHGRELLTSVFGPLGPFFMRRAFRHLTMAFPNSNEVLRLTKEKTSAPCSLQLVHPGVDPELFHRQEARFLRDRYGLGSAPVIVSITRMVARKNLRALIEVLPAVRETVPGTKLVLGGTGPERIALEKLAGSLDLVESVIFTGRIANEELVAHYSLADVFALPSLSFGNDIEGFGIVYLEAGACEVAVVGSDAGGVPDAVAHGETGLLIEPENREKLKDALIKLLQNPELAKTFGRQARARIQKSFTWKAVSQHVMARMK